LLTNKHIPPEYRMSGIVRDLRPWYAAFNVKRGDRL